MGEWQVDLKIPGKGRFCKGRVKFNVVLTVYLILLPLSTMRYLFMFILLTAASRVPAQKTVNITIDAFDTAQRIDNFGASAAWYSEFIGRSWPLKTKEKLAEWLFSNDIDRRGDPRGIALSAFRFNLGGGTAEQGDSSGIKDFRRRVECFLQRDGRYDWSRQAGYLWFARRAREYGVADLIAFSNTPPVQFTGNGLGYKTLKDHRSNLRAGCYPAFADFLATVLQHFDAEGLHFTYISPVNEPQWDWADPYGQGGQEGSPWTNAEILALARCLDSVLSARGLSTKILLTEAGSLDYLYGQDKGEANHQIQQLFGGGSRWPHVPPMIGGHGYFTDKRDSNRIGIRERLADTASAYGLGYWQTEYSMLGDGYKEGKAGRIPAMDCALFLAKVIHDDLVYGNARAWQFWNSWEPADPAADTRYCLIALQPANDSFGSGNAVATKNLWALGHYSRFVRPGMQRLRVGYGDALTPAQRASQVMVSCFAGRDSLVLVAINYSGQPQQLRPVFRNAGSLTTYTSYVTTAEAGTNMRSMPARLLSDGIDLAPRSICTVVIAPIARPTKSL